MGKAATSSTDVATSFEGKECGSGTFTPGETLTIAVSGGGTYLLQLAAKSLQWRVERTLTLPAASEAKPFHLRALQVSGGMLTDSGNKCDGTRLPHMGGSANTFTLETNADATMVEAWIGRGTGPTSADMPVAVHTKCTLTASSGGGGGGGGGGAVASSPPPAAASPSAAAASPPPPVAASPTVVNSPPPSSSSAAAPPPIKLITTNSFSTLAIVCIFVALLFYSPWLIGVGCSLMAWARNSPGRNGK
ncbi:MAG: hypothetical protein SGPRY_004126 [Prymnesium sp.]